VGIVYDLNSPPVILTRGALTNKGYGIENSFTFNWSMGIMQGTMNTTSIFDQLVNGDVVPDEYIVTVYLTLSVY
jgi:hypothetical protein